MGWCLLLPCDFIPFPSHKAWQSPWSNWTAQEWDQLCGADRFSGMTTIWPSLSLKYLKSGSGKGGLLVKSQPKTLHQTHREKVSFQMFSTAPLTQTLYRNKLFSPQMSTHSQAASADRHLAEKGRVLLGLTQPGVPGGHTTASWVASAFSCYQNLIAQ